MHNEKITLAIIWISVMLTYLFGDVIHIFAGDVTLRAIQGVKITQAFGLGIAILMVVLFLVMLQNTKRWANTLFVDAYRRAYHPDR